MKKFFEEKRPHNGMTYGEFARESEEFVNTVCISDLSTADQAFFNYTKLNIARSNRINKTFAPDSEITELIRSIDSKQIWMVLTEDWCGDSAQNLPYINKLAELNENIDLRILHREDNLDIMDQYLHNGKARAIPKLVAFDEDGNEIFQWGPRPKAIQQKVEQWKTEGISKDEYNKNLHAWYAKDKGQALINEFTEILKDVVGIYA